VKVNEDLKGDRKMSAVGTSVAITSTSTAAHPDGLRIAVVGSRDFADLGRVRRFVQTLPAGIILVSGGARGVDRCAAAAARVRGLRCVEYFADWDRDGRHDAGRIRNEQVVRHSDRMVAFWDGRSTGTHDAISRARQLRRPLTIYRLRLAALVGRLGGQPVLETSNGTARADLSLVADWPGDHGRRIAASGKLAEALAQIETGRQLRVRATLRQLFYTDAEGILQHRDPTIEARSFKILPRPRRAA
jgi:hypothetical protein